MTGLERRKTSSEETQTPPIASDDGPQDSYSLAEVKSLLDHMHLKYVNDMQTNLHSLSDTLTKRVDQCDATVKHVKSTLPTSDEVETVSDKLEGAEQMLEQYRADNRKLDAEIKNIQTNVQSDIANIHKQYPPLHPNDPIFTKIPNIVLPRNQAFQLASKTVDVKTLTRTLTANVTINSDSSQDIHLFYSKLSQCLDIAASTTSLLPPLHSCALVPDFYSILVPPQNHAFFAHIHNAYVTMSNCIYTFIHTKDTIATKAKSVHSVCSELANSTDGFQYISLILHRTLPQFGGPKIKLTDELGKLNINNGEMLQEFHTRALLIQSNIIFSKITVSKTLFFETYLDNLKQTQLFHLLQVQIRKFNTHRRLHGDNTLYPDSISDVYQELLDSGIPSTTPLNSSSPHLAKPPSNPFFNPSANATSTSLCIPTNSTADSLHNPEANATFRKSNLPCECCGLRHSGGAENCGFRSIWFLTPSVRQRVERYNLLHGDKPKIPKKDRIVPQKPTFLPTKNPAANATIASIPSPIIQNHSFSSPSEDIVPINHQPSPSPNQIDADASNNIIEEHQFLNDLEYYTPVAQSVETFLPSANMTSCPTNNQLSSSLSPPTYCEQDEIICHHLLSSNQKSDPATETKQYKIETFHADWGANIIIVNSMQYFHAYKPTSDTLQHVGGGSLRIQGYGTIIIQLRHKCHVIRNVAFVPENPKNTFTASHLFRENRFKGGTHSIHTCVKLIDEEGYLSKLPISTVHNNLDYVEITMLLPYKLPSANIASKNQLLTPQLIHQKCGHYHYERIQHLAKNKLIEGLPINLPKMSTPCPICLQVKSRKKPRGHNFNYNDFKPGELLSMDFAFMPQNSLRGFKSFLSVKDAATNYTWVFPTRHKRAPLEILTHLFGVLRKEERVVKRVRVDEDGALARNTEYCKLIALEKCVLETTGGYASNKNGKSESLNKVIKHSILTSLVSANMPLDFWCFALQHHNHTIRNLSLSPCKSKTAKEAWTNSKPKWHDFRIPFCDVYVVHDDDTSLGKATRHTFLCFGPSTSIVYYYDKKTSQIKRAHHVYFDDFSSGRPSSEETPGSKLLKNESATLDEINLSKTDISAFQKYITKSPKNSPFQFSDLFIHLVDMTNENKPLYGLQIKYDDNFGLPLIDIVSPESSFFNHLPVSYRRNIWIASIEDDEPITPSGAYEAIDQHVSSGNPIVTFIICKRTISTRSQIQTLRSQFDQYQRIHKRPSCTSNPTTHIPSAAYAISLPEKPDTPKNIVDIKRSQLKAEWKLSLFENYSKNAKALAFTAPFPRELLPPNARILKSVLAFRVKTLSPGVYDLYSRHCANGSTQIKGLDYKESYAPIAVIDSIRVCIAISADLCLIIFIIDVSNAFQNTPVNINERIHLYLPPYYLEWFRQQYPHHILPSTKTFYVLQSIHAIQGTKPAGKQWHDYVRKFFLSFGLKPNSTDNAVFVHTRGKDILILLSETDDFLILSSSTSLYLELKAHLAKAFSITTQEGPVLKYLNLRIIQSEAGISIDQTQHILDMVQPHYPKNSNFTKTDSPFRTDRSYESEIINAIPSTKEELALLEQQYGGSYLSLYGQLLHVSTLTRPQISNAMLRLGKFQSSPCKLAFDGLKRIFRYLATHPNIPIMYPKHHSQQKSILTAYQPTQPTQLPKSVTLPKQLSAMVDSNYGTDLSDRKSVSSCLILFNGVVVSWKATRQMCIATSTTDAEIRSLFTGLRKVITFRNFLRHLGRPELKPTIIFEDNKGTSDIVRAGRLTPRVKHIDIPLCYIHEQNAIKSFDIAECPSHLMLADGLNKALTGPVIQRHSRWYTGYRYYPKPGTQHSIELMKPCPLSA